MNKLAAVFLLIMPISTVALAAPSEVLKQKWMKLEKQEYDASVKSTDFDLALRKGRYYSIADELQAMKFECDEVKAIFKLLDFADENLEAYKIFTDAPSLTQEDLKQRRAYYQQMHNELNENLEGFRFKCI